VSTKYAYRRVKVVKFIPIANEKLFLQSLSIWVVCNGLLPIVNKKNGWFLAIHFAKV
jgi:hypothetical protein